MALFAILGGDFDPGLPADMVGAHTRPGESIPDTLMTLFINLALGCGDGGNESAVGIVTLPFELPGGRPTLLVGGAPIGVPLLGAVVAPFRRQGGAQKLPELPSANDEGLIEEALAVTESPIDAGLARIGSGSCFVESAAIPAFAAAPFVSAVLERCQPPAASPPRLAALEPPLFNLSRLTDWLGLLEPRDGSRPAASSPAVTWGGPAAAMHARPAASSP